MSELPPGWDETTLGDATEATRPICYGVLKPGPYDPSGIPLLRIQDLVGNRVALDGFHRITSELDAEYSRSKLEGGEVLLSIQGTVGRVAITPAQMDGANISRTLAVIAPDGRLERSFLRYYLEHLANGGAYETGGTTRASLNISTIRKMRVPMPPLNEQRRIVKAIEKQFSRLDAADASLAQARLKLDVLVCPIRQRATESGSEHLLDDLLDGIEAGKSFKCHGRAADPGEWGVIKVSAMTWGSFKEHENKAVLSDQRVDPRWEILPGDLLLSRANTTDYVGATVLVRECRRRLLLSDKSMRLLVKDKVHRPWLLHALSAPSVRAQMSAVATGTSDSMRNVSQEKVKSVQLRVPPLEEQRRIVAEVEERLSVIDAMRASIDRAQRRSAALRRSILERAFSGELVPQDPSDEPASVLLDRIRAERELAGAAAHPHRRTSNRAK